nr:hypothetical protein [Klebsiella michiganensis]
MKACVSYSVRDEINADYETQILKPEVRGCLQRIAGKV